MSSFFPAGSFEASASQIEILLDIREQGMEAFKDVRNMLAEIAAASVATAAVLEGLNAAQEEVARGAEEEADALKEVRNQAAEATTSVAAYGAVSTAVAAGMGAIWAALTAPRGWWQALVVGLLIIVGPLAAFGPAVLGATVILSDFLVAASAFGVLIGGIGLGFAALGAGMAALGLASLGTTDVTASLTKLQAAQKALDDFNQSHPVGVAFGPSASSQQRVADLQGQIVDLQEQVAASKTHTPTLQQHQRMEDLNVQLQRAQGAAVGGVTGLTPAEAARQRDLIQALSDAQAEYNKVAAAAATPVGVLKQGIDDLGEALGAQALPFVQEVAQALLPLLPIAQEVGSALIQWFGDRIPGVISAFTEIFKELEPYFRTFGDWLSQFIDKVFSMTTMGQDGTIKTLGQVFEDFVILGIRGIEGFLTVLYNLSQWFLERLPTYGPIVQQVFGWVGEAVKWLAGKFGDFGDWLAENWPGIMKLAAGAARDFKEQWDKWAPIIQPLIDNMMPALAGLLQLVADNAGALVPIFFGFMATLVFVTGMLLILIATIEVLIKWVTAIAVAWNNTTLSVVENIRTIIDALNNIPGVNIPMPPIPGQGGAAVERRGRAGGSIYGAAGFEGTVYRPTAFIAGEGAGAEDVSIRPQGSAGASSSDAEIVVLLRGILAALTATPGGRTGVEAALYKAVAGAGANRIRGMSGA